MHPGELVVGPLPSRSEMTSPNQVEAQDDLSRPTTRSRPSSPGTMQSTSSSVSGDPFRSPSPALRRGTKTRYLEDIRHEVMVNYLFQQQCSHLWLDHDNPSEFEGIILRKAKGTYLTCPPNLVHSPLANACFDLNLQVSSATSHSLLD